MNPGLVKGKVKEGKIRAYCKRWAEVIFVREWVEGHWTSVSLASLSAEMREKWVAHFVEHGFIPHAHRLPDDIPGTKE